MPPAPKRSSERRRRNKDSKPETVTATGAVEAPDADEAWNPIARDWFDALKTSGQAQFFEPSDWAAARYVAEVMSRHLERAQPSAQLFSGIWGAMSDLLSTEASRRRVRMEVERVAAEPGTPAGVTALHEYRRELAG